MIRSKTFFLFEIDWSLIHLYPFHNHFRRMSQIFDRPFQHSSLNYFYCYFKYEESSFDCSGNSYWGRIDVLEKQWKTAFNNWIFIYYSGRDQPWIFYFIFIIESLGFCFNYFLHIYSYFAHFMRFDSLPLFYLSLKLYSFSINFGSLNYCSFLLIALYFEINLALLG